MRRGQLTDAQTLSAYESGSSIVALAVAEGLSAYGVISRLSRARRRRGRGAAILTRRARAARQPVDSWADLEASIARLQRSVSRLR